MQLLSHGAVIAILLFAGVLASVLGLVLLVLYKRTIGRHMQRVVAVGQIGNQDDCPRQKPLSQLTYSIEHPGRTKGAGQPVSASFDSTFGCAAIYLVAALIFGIVATCLLFTFSDIQFLPLRTACVVWAYAWPIVLTLNLLWSSDRRRQLTVIAVYTGVIALFCLWSVLTDSRPSSIATMTFPAFANPILVWAIYAAPSVFLCCS